MAKITGQQIKQGLSKVVEFFKNLRSTSTPTPPSPPAPNPYAGDWLDVSSDALKAMLKETAVPVGAEVADLVARQAMDEGSDKDLVRTALQTVVAGSMYNKANRAYRGIRKTLKEKKLTGATNPKTNAPYTEDEIKAALTKIDNESGFGFYTDEDGKRHGPNKKLWVPAAAIGADAIISRLALSDSTFEDNVPKKTLYSSENERFRTRENIKEDYNKAGLNFTEEDDTKYNWNKFIKQGKTYYDNKSMRHALQYRNIVTRSIPNGISSVFGIDSNNVLPSAGTKIKGYYDTEDNDFMKFTQALYQIDDAIKNSKRLNLDDDLKFDWNKLNDNDKNRFADYIKVLAKEDPKKAKTLLQNFSEVGFGGLSKDRYKKFAKFHNIDLD